MEKNNTAPAISSTMSASLLARKVYCVCFPKRDGLDGLNGELKELRQRFFSGGKKTVKIKRQEPVKGFSGRLSGKLSKRHFYWRKIADRIALEESFDIRGGYVLVRRDFRGVIMSRTYFDRDNSWIKSEYYEPQSPTRAAIIFKPDEISDLIERFDRSPGEKRSRGTFLHPLPYLSGTAEQSIINARFGEPDFIVCAEDGDFCYCPKKDAQQRLAALEELKSGTVLLMPAWEIREGELTGEEPEEAPMPDFGTLEDCARLEAPQSNVDDEPYDPARLFADPAEHSAEESDAPQDDSAEGFESAYEELLHEDGETAPDSEQGLVEDKTEQEKCEPEKSESEKAVSEAPAESNERGGRVSLVSNGVILGDLDAKAAIGGVEIKNGVLCGRERTEHENGLTAYEGEFKNGLRDGFGSSYDKNGSLIYAGGWKSGKKDGLGVSFRESDHAMHISRWKNGEPGEMVSIFDKDGNFLYGGRFVNGKKQGAGLSYRLDGETVFVGKWADGKPAGVGCSFDRDGSLLYYGEWKDGKRCGRGTEFDRNGGIVFDGEWKDDGYFNGILYQR